MQNHDLYSHISSCVNIEHTFPSPENNDEPQCMSLFCSCLGECAQILGMMAVFFLRIHTVRVKMDTEKIPNKKKSIAIAIYLFIVMYFITNRREGLVVFDTA